MTRTTKAQREAIYLRWRLAPEGKSYRQLRAAAQATFGCDGAIALPWCGMWLCIERNGYTHS